MANITSRLAELISSQYKICIIVISNLCLLASCCFYLKALTHKSIRMALKYLLSVENNRPHPCLLIRPLTKNRFGFKASNKLFDNGRGSFNI